MRKRASEIKSPERRGLEETREALRAACVESGSQTAFAATHGLSTTHLSQVLNGRFEPNEKELAAIGRQFVEGT